MADSAPRTGYQPKLANFFSYINKEHTPVDIPDSHHNFLCPDDATVVPTSPEGLPNSRASSSSKQTAAGRVPSELDKEPVATTICGSQSKVKEVEKQTLCIR